MATSLPDAIHRFLQKNEDYKDDNDEFGAKGEVMQLAKKVKKIKRAIWDGESLTGEPVEELIDDLIGHCLLLKEQLVAEGVVHYGDDPAEVTADEWMAAYEHLVSDNFYSGNNPHGG